MDGFNAQSPTNSGVPLVAGSFSIQGAPPQTLDAIRELCKQRFDFFCAAVLGYKVTPFHAKMISHIMLSKTTMVLAPRGSGKSTIGDVAYALWKMINDPNIRICIASKSGPQAKSFLGEIKAHIESNEDFRLLFGDLKGETWNEDEITISTRTKIRKEPTITAKSVGQGMPGFHFDLIIADDLCDLENTATELQRNKMKQWFYVVLAPTLEPHGEFRVIGTRYHPQDLYGHFAGERGRTENDEPLWNDKRFGPYTLVIPALTVNEKGEEESFWPEYFSVEYLQDKRAEGLLFFNLAYQNDARISEGGIIQIDDLLEVVYLHDGDRPRNEDLIIFQGVDPAIGQKQTNDFFAHATIGIHNYKDIFVLQLTKQRIPFGNQVDYIIEQWMTWAAQLVGIETIAYQKALVMAIQERTPWFPVHEVRPRVDKTMRARVFSDYTRRREVHFRADMTESMTNIAAMPGVLHDDDFDALDIAIEAAKQQVLSPSVIGKIQTNFRRR